MIRRPPRSTLDRSSAASDVYKRQEQILLDRILKYPKVLPLQPRNKTPIAIRDRDGNGDQISIDPDNIVLCPVSYTHLRAHETVLDLVCRLLLEKKKQTTTKHTTSLYRTDKQLYNTID